MFFHQWKSAITIASLLTLAGAVFAQDNEGAAMANDSHDQACVQLQETGNWSSSLPDLSGVGTVTTLAMLLTNLSETAVALTSATHPPVVGYHSGMRWSDADMATTAWAPQGLTTGSSGSTDFSIVSWHSTGTESANMGSRVSIVDTTNLSTAMYRNVILVNPTGVGTYVPVKIHAGGLALAGHYLYVADASHGFRVFDLKQIHHVDGSNDTCSGVFGKVGSSWCANGYAYMLPQVGAYNMPTKMSNGTTIPDDCKPKFSWAGNDTRPSTPLILSGEYCAPPVAGNPDSENKARECENSASDDELDTTGLNGRLYQWPLGSNGRLVTSSGGYVTPVKVYYMNERNVQGIGPDMIKDGSGNYDTDTYWLATTRASGTIFKVSPSADAKSWALSDSLAPYAPEGMHSTLTSGHLWITTEGESGVTDPSSGGRVLISIQQSSVN